MAFDGASPPRCFESSLAQRTLECGRSAYRLFILRAADVRRGAVDMAHPRCGFGKIIGGGWVDQCQPLRGGAGRAGELILVHQDKVQGQAQQMRLEFVLETDSGGVSRRSPRPVIAHLTLPTLGIDRPDAQVIHRRPNRTSIFHPCRTGVADFLQVIPA